MTFLHVLDFLLNRARRPSGDGSTSSPRARLLKIRGYARGLLQPRHAFTMIEMMVVIFLIGVMATFVIPKLAHKTPQSEWSTILYDLNNLAFFARQEAISNQAVYRLNFKSGGSAPDMMIIEKEEQDPEKAGKRIYTPVSTYYLKTQYQFHPSVKIKAFYHGKKEEISDSSGNPCCYIVHDGLVQDVIIHLVRTEKGVESRVSFKMMPFYGKFEQFDDFIKPEF